MINYLDFQDADIARLAIHIRETVWECPARGYSFDAGATSYTPGSGSGILFGAFLSNSDAANAAAATIYDGAGDTGQQLLAVSVPSAGVFTWPPSGPGIRFERGLFVSLADTVSGTLFAAFDH